MAYGTQTGRRLHSHDTGENIVLGLLQFDVRPGLIPPCSRVDGLATGLDDPRLPHGCGSVARSDSGGNHEFSFAG